MKIETLQKFIASKILDKNEKDVTIEEIEEVGKVIDKLLIGDIYGQTNIQEDNSRGKR